MKFVSRRIGFNSMLRLAVIGLCIGVAFGHRASADENDYLAEESAQIIQQEQTLLLPDGLPDAFSVDILVGSQTLILELEKNSIFGDGTRLLVSGADGELVEHPIGRDLTYLGQVAGIHASSVSAVLSKNGLIACIDLPGSPTIFIDPVPNQSDRTLHVIAGTELEGEGISTAAAASLEAESAPATVMLAAAPSSIQAIASTPTLPPNHVMDVLEYEIGVEISSRSYLDSGSYNSNMDTAIAKAQSVITNMDRRYLHASGVKSRLGTLIVRTDAATDPLRDAITSNAASGLYAFRDYWNSHGAEVGTTHDIAVYHCHAAPSGMSFVNSVGSGNRYALTCGRSNYSWADGTIVHEFGHSWNLEHTTDQEEKYESKPRSNGNASGGEHVYISVMHGSGDHNIGRCASMEAERVYNTRQNKRNYGDLIADPEEIKPFGFEDNISLASYDPVLLDVVANDYDCNNDPLNVRLRDTVSYKGATISLSEGTGPGGRDELLFTPQANAGDDDFFHYTVVDTTGKTDWGCVYIKYDGIITVNLGDGLYNYDFGPVGQTVDSGWKGIIPGVTGDASWTGDSIQAVDRGTGTGVNNINRDIIYGTGISQFNHKLGNGIWEVKINMGDAGYARDLMGVRAEGQVLAENINAAANEFPYAQGNVTVTDGELNLEFYDEGGSNPYWVASRLTLTRKANIGTVDLSATEYNYDLGPASSPVLSGWQAIDPSISGDIYWSGDSINSADRNPSGVNDANRDLIYGNGISTLNHKIANGLWRITLNMGDDLDIRDLMKVRAEGVTIASSLTAEEGSYPYAHGDITVTDGELNLEFSDEGGDNAYWVATRLSLKKIGDHVDGYVTIDQSATQYDYDLGPADGVVQSGWREISPETFGDISWTGAAVTATDRNPGGGVSDINRDFVSGSGASTFNHAISNGIWQITLNLGDATGTHDQMRIVAEGSTIATELSSAAGRFPEVTGEVTVSDGELNIEFYDDGGSDPDWVLNRMTLLNIRDETIPYWTLDGPEDFNGSSDYQNLPDATAANTSTELTMMVTITPDTKGDFKGILTCTGDYFGLLISGYGTGNPVEFRAMNNYILSPDNTCPVGTPTHIAAVWKSGEIQKLYLDGVEVASDSTPPTGAVNVQEWFVGRDREIGGRFFDGEMRDLKIWARALSATEIYDHYTAETFPPTPNPAGFVSAPTATGTSSITMTAITGSDVSGPVEYLFTETSGNFGGISSSWQTSPSFTATGLNHITEYSYTVTMRDARGNTGSPSVPASATTDLDPQLPLWTHPGPTSFNGSSDYLNLNNPTAGNGTTELTIVATVTPTSKGDNEGIATSTGDYFGLLLSGYGEGNPAEFRAMGQSLLAPNHSCPVGTATHIAGVWKSGEIHKLYLNGVEVASESSPRSGTMEISEWTVGSDRLINNRLFHGDIEGLKIWTRALSAAEISALVNDDDNDGLPNDWENLYFGNSTSAHPSNDSDNDKLSNLEEYAFGGNPTDSADQGSMPWLEQGPAGVDYYFTLRDDPALKATVLTTTDLVSGTWSTNGVMHGMDGTDFTTGTSPLPDANLLFIKLHIEK